MLEIGEDKKGNYIQGGGRRFYYNPMDKHSFRRARERAKSNRIHYDRTKRIILHG